MDPGVEIQYKLPSTRLGATTVISSKDMDKWQHGIGMYKTLILHIGHFKTGTTALQVFFSQNKRYLNSCGVEYPDARKHNAKHSAFAFSILKHAGVTDRLMHGYSNPTPPQEMWAELFSLVAKKRRPTTLISSEEFMRLGEYPAAQDILRDIILGRPKNVEVKAIAYLRDPNSHLRSWYNQLIKMNIPVSEINSSVQGDIEGIHFDYRRALKPWIDILGAQNVIIRPYKIDRSQPDELHRDFMLALGHELPEGFVGSEDPNPRLDNRVLEIIRLMQNMQFPQETIYRIRKQAISYLAKQDSWSPPGCSDDGMETVRRRSLAGLEWLGQQPLSSVPVEDFSLQLPEGLSKEEVERNILLGFVFEEFIRLRQRVNHYDIPDIIARLESVEAQLLSQNKEDDST